MTKQESFKKRIRARMEKTGERYAAARSALLTQPTTDRRREWVSEPETSDESVRKATGRGWDDWCDLIDAWPDRSDDHTHIATYVRENHETDPWWSQTITVGYERITGLRLPYQRPDGTFTAGKSKTVQLSPSELRSMLLSADDRADLFPGYTSKLESKLEAKAIRISIGPGIAHFGIAEASGGRAKVTVEHRKLPTYAEVEEWKFYWTEWLDALDE